MTDGVWSAEECIRHTRTRLLAGPMAERGLRLSQGLDEALEDWDESGAEESNDDSDGGESEIERRAEELRRLMPY